MFCGNCGKSIEDTALVCPFCGTAVNKVASEGTAVNKAVSEENDSKYDKIFVEPDETYIGSLGNSYLNSFLTSKNIKQCVGLLSDKRVYLRGNMIDVNAGKLQRYNVQKTVDLEDITGTGFVYASSALWKLILAGCLIILELFIWGTHWGMLGLVAQLVDSIAVILLIVSYFKNRNTLFFIEYAGGCIKFDATIYGLAESQDFEKQIRRAKNKVKENK